MRWWSNAFVLLLMVFGSWAVAIAAVPLPKLNIDPKEVSVSGLSSGGYMAVQLHVAHSSTIKGVGAVAAGPYYCAESSLVTALWKCMNRPQSIEVQKLASITQQWAQRQEIDPTSHLQRARVYLYSGTRDSKVDPGVVAALRSYYLAFTSAAQIVYKSDIASEHAMITANAGQACQNKDKPFINNCNFDLAGAILNHLHDGLRIPGTTEANQTQLIEFDQREFIQGHGMAPSGWAYIPSACNGGRAVCKLHVALHGCQQNVSEVGMAYVRDAGYNRWAEVNNIVVLYPQTGSGATNGCWDWWGYDSENYAKKSGPQIKAISTMIQKTITGVK